jgi:hypothetical protein
MNLQRIPVDPLSRLAQALLWNALRHKEGRLLVADFAWLVPVPRESGLVGNLEQDRPGAVRRALLELVMHRLLVALEFNGQVFSLTEYGRAFGEQICQSWRDPPTLSLTRLNRGRAIARLTVSQDGDGLILREFRRRDCKLQDRAH